MNIDMDMDIIKRMEIEWICYNCLKWEYIIMWIMLSSFHQLISFVLIQPGLLPLPDFFLSWVQPFCYRRDRPWHPSLDFCLTLPWVFWLPWPTASRSCWCFQWSGCCKEWQYRHTRDGSRCRIGRCKGCWHNWPREQPVYLNGGQSPRSVSALWTSWSSDWSTCPESTGKKPGR